MTTAARKKQKTGGASAGPTIFRKRQKVGGVTTGPQDLMFANSDEHGHLVHMAVQHKYTKDGETHCGFGYASFPTLRDMVAYAETFAAGQPQCLFELAREGTVVAPYMDIDCTLLRFITPEQETMEELVESNSPNYIVCSPEHPTA